jgi:murein DD-endopeptidase MepM/ murein hydrolase activator NlpD
MKNVTTVLIVLLVLGGFAFALWRNAQPAPAVVVIIPSQQATTDPRASINDLLQGNFANSTALPTIALPTQPYVAPTLAIFSANTTPIAPNAVPTQDNISSNNGVVTPTRPNPTATPLSLTAQAGDNPTVNTVSEPQVTQAWNPPPLVPPISRDPFGRDHYWFLRPVDSDATNYGLYYYSYGSDGTAENPWRVHHGIDMPNPIGETVRAAGSGVVVWASDGLRVDDGPFQNTYSYGNVVQIQHDFGYKGQTMWTLYAHLSAVLVQNGQYVNAGDPIGLVGNSGLVSGPHVHFEVRIGENAYGRTYNPLLWMVPYVDHGTIAGRVLDSNGNLINDLDITVRNWNTGLIESTTTSYVYLNTGSDVNADPEWGENFVVGDIPTGRYEVSATINGVRVSKVVEVFEGQTSFVELVPVNIATPQDVPTNSP